MENMTFVLRRLDYLLICYIVGIVKIYLGGSGGEGKGEDEEKEWEKRKTSLSINLLKCTYC